MIGATVSHALSFWFPVALFAFVARLLAAFARQGMAFRALRPDPDATPATTPAVSVIIPARNEAENIGRCVAALQAQDYAGALEIIAVDDSSQDDTAAIVRRLASGDPRVRLVSAPPLPPGWVGKPHACHQGARAASGELLCFVDADTVAEPCLVRAVVAMVEQRGADLLTLNPFQEMGSFWERALMPTMFLLCGLWSNQTRVNDRRYPDATANGQFILFRRAAYQSIGGHEPVRQAVLEDLAVARLVKGRGLNLHSAPGDPLIRTRMYTSFSAVWRGFSKMAVTLLGGVPTTLGAAVGLLLTGWAPLLSCLVLLTSRPGLPLLCSLAALCGLASAHMGVCRFYRAAPQHALLFPIAHTIGAAILLNGVYRSVSGRNEWRGRGYTGTDQSWSAG